MALVSLGLVCDAALRTGARDGEWTGLPGVAADANDQLLRRLRASDLDEWATSAARVGFCTRPIRLVGSSTTVYRGSGEVLGEYASTGQPGGVTLVRCGNRRERECPSCSRIYAADTFHLIRAGVAGGKGVPESVVDNPLVFATLTAPSFGAVHRRGRKGRCRRHRGAAARCRHGRPLDCSRSHEPDDPLLGQPLCADCYDYEGHVVWQWWAPELWRRFTIALRRRVAVQLGADVDHVDHVASVQYAKVAEYQHRGAVHFHALVRLDGPRTGVGFTAAPEAADARLLARLVEQAVGGVALLVPPVHDDDVSRTLAFGVQVDVRVVQTSRRTDAPDGPLTGEQVAGYLAKYATKSAADGASHDNTHLRRLHDTARRLAAAVRTEADPGSPYRLLGRWAHTLGFRGHFSTKSRNYSVTLGRLRRARQRAQARIAEARRTGTHVDLRDLEAELLADDSDETTLVIGSWRYAGSGWADEGEAALATAVAVRSREYARERACARRRAATAMATHTGKG